MKSLILEKHVGLVRTCYAAILLRMRNSNYNMTLDIPSWKLAHW